MSADDQLTVLLALKDRVPFTFRWMRYADNVRFPFKVYIADGGSDDRVAAALSDRTAYPHVDYEYVRYPPDKVYCRDFWIKTADALTRIHTPFVALAANDDLFVVSGLTDAVRFLATHPDYATCGGQCAVFWVTGATDGEEGPCYGTHVRWKHSVDARSLDQDTARERLRRLPLRTLHSGYYHVRRTEDFRRQVDVALELGLRDVFLDERLLLFLGAIAGKMQELPTLYFARQWNAPESAGGDHQARYGDWFGRMLLPSWSQDFSNFVRATSAALAARDGIPIDEAQRSIVELYRLWMAPQLVGDILTEPTVSARMSVVIAAAQWLLNRPTNSLIRRAARRLYRRTPWISVDALHGTQLRTRRVAHADEAFRPIREFLASGPDTEVQELIGEFSRPLDSVRG